MKTTDQRRQHMAVGEMIVISRPIEIGRHQADRIKAILLAQGLTEFDAGNFGNRVPLICRLQCTCEKRIFLNRLFGKLRINTATTQK